MPLFVRIDHGKKLATLPAAIGPITQSPQLIALVMGGVIYSSSNGGKSFKKYNSKYLNKCFNP
jgi:hypothetical protein